jgi:hypothetical protein
MALARLLGAARSRDRIQARVLPVGLEQLASYLEVAPRAVGLSPYGRRRKPRVPRVAQPITPTTLGEV